MLFEIIDDRHTTNPNRNGQNTFCVDSLCDATGICLFCYVRGIHLFLQNNSYFCVFKYETKGQTKGLERG